MKTEYESELYQLVVLYQWAGEADNDIEEIFKRCSQLSSTLKGH